MNKPLILKFMELYKKCDLMYQSDRFGKTNNVINGLTFDLPKNGSGASAGGDSNYPAKLGINYEKLII